VIEVLADIAQGSREWHECRCGLVTASEFAAVIAKGQGKVRRAYMLRLAGERLTGEPVETYSNRHMERGKALEEEAREAYAFIHDAQPELVGFVRDLELAGGVGCSPDALLGDDGVLEIKTKLPALMVEALLRDDMLPEHIAQVQGALWVTRRRWADVVCYWPTLPLCVRRVGRDEDYIDRLAAEVGQFNAELAAIVARLEAAA
jgi:YqaJ-like viral recombinase domain